MRRRLKILLWRYRHVIAAGLVAIALLGLVREVRPAPAGEPMLVALVDLPAGEPIGPLDVGTVVFPSGVSGVVADPVGLRPVISIPAGVPITETMVLGPEFARHAPRGTVVAPVHVADPTLLRMLRVGDQVDLYAPSPASAEATLVSSGVQVLALPGEAPASLLPFGQGEASAFIGAIPAGDAKVFTGASGLAPFRIVISAG